MCCTEIDSCILKIDAFETTHTIVGAKFCLRKLLRQASIKPQSVKKLTLTITIVTLLAR
ncbi:hypothetical protein YC2023_018287 [Brassica napus]